MKASNSPVRSGIFASTAPLLHTLPCPSTQSCHTSWIPGLRTRYLPPLGRHTAIRLCRTLSRITTTNDLIKICSKWGRQSCMSPSIWQGCIYVNSVLSIVQSTISTSRGKMCLFVATFPAINLLFEMYILIPMQINVERLLFHGAVQPPLLGLWFAHLSKPPEASCFPHTL